MTAAGTGRVGAVEVVDVIAGIGVAAMAGFTVSASMGAEAGGVAVTGIAAEDWSTAAVAAGKSDVTADVLASNIPAKVEILTRFPSENTPGRRLRSPMTPHASEQR
jgi:hypothetical protein